MREIKFRGKMVYGDEWVYGYYVGLDLEGGAIIRTALNDFTDDGHPYGYHVGIEVIPETVGQYTGLKDKNGVEIYEGDKIKYVDDFDLSICEDKVIYDSGSFLPVSEGYCQEVEVIGNIHENPELLKEGE